MNWRTSLSSIQVSFASCLISGVLAVLCTASFLYRTATAYDKEMALSSIEQKILKLAALSQEKQQAENAAQKADKTYLEKHLSSLPLLNIERGSLELLARKKSLNESQARRLNFVQKTNMLHFKSHKKVDTGICREVEEKLIHTVEIDAEDLQIILEKLEGRKYQHERPPLRIRRLSLEKKDDSPHYTLYLELWRKEIL